MHVGAVGGEVLILPITRISVSACHKSQFRQWPQWCPLNRASSHPKGSLPNPWRHCIRFSVCKLRHVHSPPPPPPSPPPTRLRIIKAAVLAIATGSTPDDDDGSGNASSPLLPAGGGLRPGEERVPPHLEVAHIPYEQGGPYPGLFLFTQAARMARPVKQV